MVSEYFRLLQMINLIIFQIGEFSNWIQTGFRMVSYWHKGFQIVSSDLILLQIDFRLISDSFQNGLKIVKTSDFVFTFQIASDWPDP